MRTVGPGLNETLRAAGLCLNCLLALALLLAAIVASFAWLDIDYEMLVAPDSLRSMGEFLAEFLHPDFAPEFLAKVAWGSLQTLAMSGIGTLLAVLFGGLLALPASGRNGGAARWVARLLCNVLRSVPELVWGVLMVLAAGLGPFAGTLALMLHTSGVLGRLYAETLENAPREPERVLRDAGAGAVAAFAYGILPQATAQGLAYALYRWEMNIRMAAILGFVGAGGLGQLLYFHLAIFQQAQAATVLLAMILLVLAVDALSNGWRRLLASAQA